MNIYEEKGYKNREEYLDEMAAEYDVDRGTVGVLAEVLGDSEDFDGLICELEDMEFLGEYCF